MLKNLTNKPIHRSQPSKNTCVPTSLAMAFGLSPITIIQEMVDMFDIDFDKEGIILHQISEYLTRNNIGGCSECYRSGKVPSSVGSYLLFKEVDSSCMCHCLFLFISEGGVLLLNPASNMENRDTPPPSFILKEGNPGFIGHLKLHDFNEEG